MLLNWLKRRLFEKSRLIFQFFDGRTSRRVDPLAVYFLLRTDPELILETHCTLLENEPSDESPLLRAGCEEAWQIAGRAVGRAFGLPEERLTIWERRQLLFSFLIYLHTIKKNISPLPISLPPTVRRRLDELTTKPASASTSTAPAPKSAAPAESPSA
jgi:hypothetical protein